MWLFQSWNDKLPPLRLVLLLLLILKNGSKMTTPVSYDNANIIGNSNHSMRAYRSEVAYQDLLANLGQCDIMIGQALREQTRITLS